MAPEPTADLGPDSGAVVEYHFPVVIEIRENPAADVADVAEQVARRLLAGLSG
jgi:hypothetical protein